MVSAAGGAEQMMAERRRKTIGTNTSATTLEDWKKRIRTLKYLLFPLVILLFAFSHRMQARTFDKDQERNDKKRISTSNGHRRIFVEYQSSKWEQFWVDNVAEMVTSGAFDKRDHCSALGNQSDYIKRFMEATCTSKPNADGWCILDDTWKPFYFHLTTGAMQQDAPSGWKQPDDGTARIPVYIDDKDSDIFSRFVYKDEVTGETYHEYIEPLVSILRHPLTCCEYEYKYGATLRIPSRNKCRGNHHLVEGRSQLVPPPQSVLKSQAGGKMQDTTRYFYFDGGASSWNLGAGGPSLSYFHELWTNAHGMYFDGGVYAYEGSTTPADFYTTVPKEHHSNIHYQQVLVRSTEEVGPASKHQDGPFLPLEIINMTSPNDYVMFKLDIDSPGVEESIVDYIVANKSGVLDYLDEFVYEFHLHGGRETLTYWYKVFHDLRKAGVRAHSWI